MFQLLEETSIQNQHKTPKYIARIVTHIITVGSYVHIDEFRVFASSRGIDFSLKLQGTIATTTSCQTYNSLIRSKEPHPLKQVPSTLKDPFASAVTAVEELIWEAISTFPHGFAALGLWTSPRVGFPCTPRAGETAAWAVTWRQRAKTIKLEAQIFSNMIILLGERDLARWWRNEFNEG